MNQFEYKVINDMKENDAQYILSLLADNLFEKECDLIGMGENSLVWRYKDYAIKVYRDNSSSKNDFEYLQKLQDIEFFPEVYMGVKDKLCVMEYIQGDTLKVRLEDFEWSLSDDIVLDLDFVLNSVLEEGLVPYDVHEGNIMIDTNGRMKVIDVGNFQELDEEDENKYYDMCETIVENIDKLLMEHSRSLEE